MPNLGVLKLQKKKAFYPNYQKARAWLKLGLELKEA